MTLFRTITSNFYSKELPATLGNRGTINNNNTRKNQPGVRVQQPVNKSNVNLQRISNVVNNTNRTTVTSSAKAMVAQSSTARASSYSVQSLNPSANRLSNNNLPSGGSYYGGSAGSGGFGASAPSISFTGGSSTGDDTRVKIIDPGGTMGMSSVVFPHTPTITVSHRANYDLENLVHTTYSTPYFTHSSVDSINVQGRFTAQNQDEAEYVRNMIQFFRTATKMFYGSSSPLGAPPPIVQLQGYGSLFENISVAVRDFTYTFPNDVNYISSGGASIPTDMTISIDLLPVYSKDFLQSFNIQSYAQGGGSFI